MHIWTWVDRECQMGCRFRLLGARNSNKHVLYVYVGTWNRRIVVWANCSCVIELFGILICNFEIRLVKIKR